MTIQTLQFEGVKIAMKQDKTGYILTLNVHPDEVQGMQFGGSKKMAQTKPRKVQVFEQKT